MLRMKVNGEVVPVFDMKANVDGNAISFSHPSRFTSGEGTPLRIE
jgi:hypothetical protein